MLVGMLGKQPSPGLFVLSELVPLQLNFQCRQVLVHNCLPQLYTRVEYMHYATGCFSPTDLEVCNPVQFRVCILHKGVKTQAS